MIYFYCLFFDPVLNMKLIHMVFTGVLQWVSPPTTLLFFLSFWKMTSKKQRVRCHSLDLWRLCIAFLQNYWFLSHFYPSLFDSKYLGSACVTHWREVSNRADELAWSALAPGGGGKLRIWKGVGMFVVSLRGVNFGFWSPLGCSVQNTIIFSRKGLF